MDPRRAPERVGECQSADEFEELYPDRRSTESRAARLPSPESTEALPVPANHGLRPNEVQCPAPPRPTVGEPHPEGTIEAPELWSLGSAAKQGELLPERQVLENEVGAGSERRA